MNNINNLLNIGKNTIQDKIQVSNVNNKKSFNSNFEDLLSKNSSKKQLIGKSTSSTNSKVSVYTISNKSLTKQGKQVIAQLNKFLSTETNPDTIKKTVETIDSILNTLFNGDYCSHQDILNIDTNIEDTNLVDIISVDELDDSILDSIQSILALLNQQQYNSANIELEINDYIVDNSDISVNNLLSDEDSLNSIDDIFNTLNSIENQITDVFRDNSLSNNSEITDVFRDNSLSNNSDITDDFMQKLMLLVQNDNEASQEANFIKKEDMLEIANNLNISSVYSNNVNSVDIIDNITSADMHPITKQVLSSIQSQISTVNLDNKTVELRLKLFPSKLGAISVTLEQDNDGLRIILQSDNPDVRSILSESISDLKQNLNNFANEVFIDVSSNKENNNTEQNNRNIHSIENINNYIEEDLVRINSDINLINKILDIKV